MENKIEIYKTATGTEVSVQLEQDTVWLNRQQLALLFDRDVKTIGKHINHVFREKELDTTSTAANFATVQRDRTVITRHISNIFKEGELDKHVVSAKFAHTTPNSIK